VTFNDAAVNGVFDEIVSHALATGRFDYVNQHEPKNAPHNGVQCSVWIQYIRPVRSSGMNATSGLVVLNARIYMDMRQQPMDSIDPNITVATADLLNVLSSDYQLGGASGVRNIDLLGAEGQPLDATAGYLELDRNMFRTVTINIPVVLNDMFQQAA